MACGAALQAGWAGVPVFGKVLWAAFVLMVFAAMMWDVRTRRIPNGLSLLLLVGGVVFSVVLQPPLLGLRSSLLGLLVGFGIWIAFYAAGLLGAGDVKFFAAASSWLGPSLSWRAAVIAAVLGGVLATVALVGRSEFTLFFRRLLLVPLTRSLGTEDLDVNNLTEAEAKRQLPYGVALGLGAILALSFPAVVCQLG